MWQLKNQKLHPNHWTMALILRVFSFFIIHHFYGFDLNKVEEVMISCSFTVGGGLGGGAVYMFGSGETEPQTDKHTDIATHILNQPRANSLKNILNLILNLALRHLLPFNCYHTDE